MASPEIRSCLTIEQSLANYAEVILSVKSNLSATKSVVIVVGGSYAGLPHIATGALTSSAPILSFDSITPEDAACAVVSKDFQELDKNCYNTIRRSLAIIDDIASQENGLEFLSRSFNTCRRVTSKKSNRLLPLQFSSGLKTYLSNVYTLVAQYNSRFNTFITSVSSAIMGDKDPINGIVKAKSLFVGSENSCLEIIADGDDRAVVFDTNSLKAWKWQGA
ncbi:uncharacterized protein LOC141646520 [Silene latifolia]|uniref:uncharacterized protein LOC141646520 n=1 Tax=Silene latifolia TaxID=37657 RepID=UPI003D76F4DA